jgi:alpha-N-arabinofuranosidase
VDAIATGNADGKRIVIKAVNYEDSPNTLLTRIQGSTAPDRATVTIYKLTAGLTDAPTMENPNRIKPVESTMPYTRDMAIELEPYTVAVVEIRAE